MEFRSLAPFVPSGPDFEKSKQLFQEIGFRLNWDAGDYAGFEQEGCRFILQKFDNRAFAENFMITVAISSAEEFRKQLLEKNLPERFGIRLGEVGKQPYGIEVNLIDIAGVCWHFVEQAG